MNASRDSRVSIQILLRTKKQKTKTKKVNKQKLKRAAGMLSSSPYGRMPLYLHFDSTANSGNPPLPPRSSPLMSSDAAAPAPPPAPPAPPPPVPKFAVLCSSSMSSSPHPVSAVYGVKSWGSCRSDDGCGSEIVVGRLCDPGRPPSPCLLWEGSSRGGRGGESKHLGRRAAVDSLRDLVDFVICLDDGLDPAKGERCDRAACLLLFIIFI